MIVNLHSIEILELIYLSTIVLFRSTECLDINSTHICPKFLIVRNNTRYQKKIEIKCCPDFYHDTKTDSCEKCGPGTFGKNCLNKCLQNYYGVQCKEMCNCSSNATCSPIYGCVCGPGWIGDNCEKPCENGKYGMNCNKTCLCVNHLGCNHITGKCICQPGWKGDHCVNACPTGRYGEGCKHSCQCASDADCDPSTGRCGKDDSDNPESSDHQTEDLTQVYILMTAAILLIVCVVAAIVRVKNKVVGFFSVYAQNKTMIKERQPIPVRMTQSETVLDDPPSIPERNIISISGALDREECGYSEIDEDVGDIYCEIGDIVDGSVDSTAEECAKD